MAKLTDRTSVQGETLIEEFTAPAGTNSVKVKLTDFYGKTRDVAATLTTSGKWAVQIETGDLVGQTRWFAFATNADGLKSVVASGAVQICPLRSKCRDVVDEIDRQIQSWGSNPNQSISVGEIQLTYKTLDELIGLRSYYEGRAIHEEGGQNIAGGGPRLMKVRFG